MTATLGRLRAGLGFTLVGLVLVAAAWSIHDQRASMVSSMQQLGAGTVVVSFGLAVLGVGVTYLEWWRIVGGMTVQLPLVSGAKVYFLSQLGKYLPGSIWPAVMQMEAGFKHGATPATMLAANLFTLMLGCTVGLLYAGVTLMVAAPAVLANYWWTLFCLPVLLAMLHPATMPRLVNTVHRAIGRTPTPARIDFRCILRACGWAAVSFSLLGAHLAILVAPLNGWSSSTLMLSVGAMSLAVCIGVLAVPVPAGAGVRDGVMTLILATAIGVGPALLVAVASRLLMSLADVVLALLMLPLKDARRQQRGQRIS